MLKGITRSLATAFSAALLATAAHAQAFPSKPIRLLVGFSAGGGSDTYARIYAAKLQEVLNTPVIVDNKPGAYELIAAQALMASQPDGHTLWMATTGSLVQGPLIRKMPYDPVTSFTHVTRIGELDAILAVKKGFPVTSVQELISYAKANPNKVNYGSAGNGAPNHLLTEYIMTLTGITMTHVPYKSDGDVVRELTAGTIDFAIANAPSTAAFVSEGKINALAVTSAKRLRPLPNTPSLEEGSINELKGMSVYAFFGVVGPAGMSPAVTKTLSDAFNKVSQMPDVIQRADGMLFRTTTSTPADFRQYIEKETAKWSEVAKKLKL